MHSRITYSLGYIKSMDPENRETDNGVEYGKQRESPTAGATAREDF
jgi:hypothetical protein